MNATESPDSNPTAKVGLEGLRKSWIFKISPLLMSAALFMSMVFSVFAPLPFLLLWFTDQKRMFLLAVLTNSAIVFLAGGAGTLAIFLILVVSTAFFLGIFLPLFKRPDTAGFLTLASMAAITVTLILVIQYGVDQQFLRSARDEFGRAIGQMQQASNPSMDSATLQNIQRKVWVELPSALGMLALFMVWGNLMLLFRLNPGRVREELGIGPQYFKYWKAPDFLIWPSLICGGLYVYDLGRTSEIALNVLKVLMAVWSIQGFAVLGYVFDKLKIAGFFRSVAYIFIAIAMMPLIVGIGFFDQWFDFRSKFRQS